MSLYRLNFYYSIQKKCMKYSHINPFCFEMCLLIYTVCLNLSIAQPESELLTNKVYLSRNCWWNIFFFFFSPDIVIFGLKKTTLFLRDSSVMIHTILKPKMWYAASFFQGIFNLCTVIKS